VKHFRRLLLLVEAVIAVAGIRAGLWLVPLRRLRHVLTYFERPVLAAERTPVRHVIWAVQAAGRHLPDSTCLVRALAAQVMLARRGYEPHVQIGFTKGERVRGHAWLECDGRAVLGGSTEPCIRLLSFE
jgi:hypothetical protein